MLLGLLDAVVFSSLWLALTAAALLAAASAALGTTADPRAVGLAFFGTLVIYNLDRLRDLERDRATSPQRSAFVVLLRSALTAPRAAAMLAALGLGLAAGPRVTALLLPALAAGLAHRRLKRFAFAKPFYLVGAWLLVVVGVPACMAPDPERIGWTTAVLGTAILANAIASNLRDPEAGAARNDPARALAIARLLALLGVAAAAIAPAAVRSLAPVPAATLLALLLFRSTERYGLVAVDGALLGGALLAIALTGPGG
jgi:4-hydroxybenzoate polyprenyltransferase